MQPRWSRIRPSSCSRGEKAEKRIYRTSWRAASATTTTTWTATSTRAARLPKRVTKTTSATLAASTRKPPRCCFCPRMGGAFRPTSDYRVSHVFCARNCPWQTRIEDGVAQLRMLPKGCLLRQKCYICGNRHGATVKCITLGCTATFHTLCGEHTGRGYHRLRNGESQAYCR